MRNKPNEKGKKNEHSYVYRSNVYLFYKRKVLETFEINCEEVRHFLRHFGLLVY